MYISEIHLMGLGLIDPFCLAKTDIIRLKFNNHSPLIIWFLVKANKQRTHPQHQHQQQQQVLHLLMENSLVLIRFIRIKLNKLFFVFIIKHFYVQWCHANIMIHVFVLCVSMPVFVYVIIIFQFSCFPVIMDYCE